jgi:TRAP-type C4-dicarboxylate transport system permease small subunit
MVGMSGGEPVGSLSGGAPVGSLPGGEPAGSLSGGEPAVPSLSGALVTVPRVFVGLLVLGAIGTMLFGVFARYVLLPITDWFDTDPVNFFWVEEVGETALAWITMIGAAVAVAERGHFHVAVLLHRLAPANRRLIEIATQALIAAFGLLTAWLGTQLAIMNSVLTSPALEFSLAWLYLPAAIGGALMALYAGHAVLIRARAS